MSIEVQRSRWSRPLVGIATVAVMGAGLGAFFGIRAVAGAGSGTGAGPTTGQPPARTDAAIAYDSANHSVVLFGGQGKSSTLHDTWIWNGSTWNQAHPATSPPALGNAQMTYDPVTRDVLLIGSEEAAVSNGGPVACSSGSGSSSSGSTGSTTIFVPPAQAVPAIAPAPTATAGTGSTSTGCATVIAPGAVTWLWNGSDWSKPSGTAPFAVFDNGALATDPVSGRVVLLPRGPFAEPDGIAEPAIACPMQAPGSDVQPSCPWQGLTTTPWTWNGHQWQKMTTSIDLGALKTFNSAIVDDAVSGKLAAFDPNDAQPVPLAVPCVARGGALLPSADATGHESVWSGTSWRQMATYNDGPVMPAVAFVGDPATHSDVALSGNGQTWIWTGSWTCVHAGTTPTVVSGAASVYDAATGQVLIFGGAGSASHQTGLFDQTWTWDGSNWTQRGGSSGPSVLVPVPSPVSIPPGLPCNPIAHPAKPVGAPVVQPAQVCNGITPGGPGSSASGSGSSGSGSGIARSYPGG
jgi:hypothetical protein